MDIAINIGVGLAGGLAGTIVALVIQIYASNRQIAKGPDVTGEWAAEYQAADLQNHPWMSETVIFWVRRGKLHFKTIRNQQDDPINRDCPDQTDSSNHVTLWDGSNYKRAA